MEASISVLSFALTVIGVCIGAAVTAAGFIAYMQRRDERIRQIEMKATFALSRTGNIMKKLGMEERYTDDLLRMLLASDRTPTTQEAVK